MLLPPRLHLTFWMFQFLLCRFSDEFWKASNIFSLFFFQVARVLRGILNWFATPLLGLTFSSSFNSLYFTFKVTSWCFLFCGHFYCVSHEQSNSNKFKDFKIFEYYGIRIFGKTFLLWHSNIWTFYSRITKDEKTRPRNQNSNYMMKNTSRQPKNLFDLDDFSNYVSSN